MAQSGTLDEKENALFPVNGKSKHHHKRDHGGLPDDMLCGIGPFRPEFLQCCARMGPFVGMYSICGLMTSILSIYVVSQITTIEKQYGLSSSQSGFLMSCNDIGFLLTTVFFSYIARKVHIPRMLWMCTVLYGLAGLICSLAYFLSKDYFLQQSKHLFEMNPSASNTSMTSLSIRRTPMCSSVSGSGKMGTGYSIGGPSSNVSKCDIMNGDDDIAVGDANKFSKLAMTLIAIGMIIQGLAKAPRHPFLTTYVDDNVTKKNTAMYMGIMSGVGIFGPAIAFAVGGVFSKIYVTLEDVPISPRHPSWIGAWWLGFVIFGFMAIFISFPLMFFPKRMRPKVVYDRRSKTERKTTVFKSFLGFLKSILRLVTNPIYFTLVISTCVVLFSIGGMVAFSAKYLETQFFIPAWKANILLGAMNIVAASAGTIVGGFIVTKKKLSPPACMKMLLIVSSLTIVVVIFGYIFGCSNAQIAGYNVQSLIKNTNESCSSSCGCDSETYFPVCGSNNVNYMSPCHAGCTHQNGTVYGNCSCIGENGTAKPALCESSTCDMLYPFLVSNVVGSFLGTLAMMPLFITVIRSVSEVDKSMAVGFSSLLTTLCGWFAGPIAFGRLVDTTCLLWSSSCSGKGACVLYDNDDLRIKKHTFEIVPKFIVMALYMFVFYKARKKTDWSVDQPDRDEEHDADEAMMAVYDDTEMATSPRDWKPDPIYTGPKPTTGIQTFS